MPRVTHVNKAQQRYHTKPVIDPATGEQKRTPVMKGNGEQRKTKTGRLVFMDVTERDLSRPKPLLRCDFPGCEHPNSEIQIGQPYKHITPKSGPYGGQQRNRHADHRSWYQWEYSNSLDARLARIQHDYEAAIVGADDPDTISSALEDYATELREVAEEKSESASNIEDGFGTPTAISEQLSETAASLESWADEIENIEVPGLEEFECSECGGTGFVDPDPDDEDDDDDEEASDDEDDDDPAPATPEQTSCPNCEDGTDFDAWNEALSEIDPQESSPL